MASSRMIFGVVMLLGAFLGLIEILKSPTRLAPKRLIAASFGAAAIGIAVLLL